LVAPVAILGSELDHTTIYLQTQTLKRQHRRRYSRFDITMRRQDFQ
jgi:hypothetical protein